MKYAIVNAQVKEFKNEEEAIRASDENDAYDSKEKAEKMLNFLTFYCHCYGAQMRYEEKIMQNIRKQMIKENAERHTKEQEKK